MPRRASLSRSAVPSLRKVASRSASQFSALGFARQHAGASFPSPQHHPPIDPALHESQLHPYADPANALAAWRTPKAGQFTIRVGDDAAVAADSALPAHLSEADARHQGA
jgi:hypothetical protein